MIKFGINGKDYSLRELDDRETKIYYRLGKAEGVDQNHCLYLAKKNTPHFEHKAIGYRKVAPSPEMNYAVEFYASKDYKAVCTKETPWDKKTEPVLHVEGNFDDDTEILRCPVCGHNWSLGPDV
jgi:hypothetical protein